MIITFAGKASRGGMLKWAVLGSRQRNELQAWRRRMARRTVHDHVKFVANEDLGHLRVASEHLPRARLDDVGFLSIRGILTVPQTKGY